MSISLEFLSALEPESRRVASKFLTDHPAPRTPDVQTKLESLGEFANSTHNMQVVVSKLSLTDSEVTQLFAADQAGWQAFFDNTITPRLNALRTSSPADHRAADAAVTALRDNNFTPLDHFMTNIKNGGFMKDVLGARLDQFKHDFPWLKDFWDHVKDRAKDEFDDVTNTVGDIIPHHAASRLVSTAKEHPYMTGLITLGAWTAFEKFGDIKDAKGFTGTIEAMALVAVLAGSAFFLTNFLGNDTGDINSRDVADNDEHSSPNSRMAKSSTSPSRVHNDNHLRAVPSRSGGASPA